MLGIFQHAYAKEVVVHTFELFLSLNEFKCATNPLYADSNPICLLLALLGAHHILHVSRTRVKEMNVL